MKKLIVVLVILASILFLFGCTMLQPLTGDSDSKDKLVDLEINLYKQQLDNNTLNRDLTKCLSEKQTCLAASTLDKNNVTSVVNQLVTCTAQKSTLESNLSNCSLENNSQQELIDSLESDLNVAQSDLNAVLSAPTFLAYYHYVSGNLRVINGYRTTELLQTKATTVIIGLDYNGGKDPNFSPEVSTQYGLNLVRWYVLTKNPDGTFTSSIDDGTVKIEDNLIQVKATEYNAATSKEGVALRRVIAFLLQ